jgi:hypothetical protein
MFVLQEPVYVFEEEMFVVLLVYAFVVAAGVSIVQQD